MVIKFDSQGRISWERDLDTGGENDGGFESAYDIVESNDGGYVVTGHRDIATPWLVRLDKAGNVAAERMHRIQFAGIRNLSDGSYVLAGPGGTGYSSGQCSSFIASKGRVPTIISKLNDSLEFIWARVVPIDGLCISAIERSNHGGFVLTGVEYHFLGDDRSWIAEVDSEGRIVWEQSLDGNGDDALTSVARTSDGGFVFTGWVESSGSEAENAWLIKVIEGGSVVWERQFGGAKDERAYAISATKDGGYVLAGSTGSKGSGGADAWVLKLDAEGRLNP